MPPRLSDFKALTFDCYGTLIDWEAGIWDALQPLFLHNRLASVDRRRALAAFGTCEHALERASPATLYSRLLVEVHRCLADRLGLESSTELDEAFGASVALWPAFGDSADALRYLATRYKLVILSNVDRAGIAASCRKLGVEFDALYTAEDIGSYKPADANFIYLLEHLESDFGLQKDEILHTAQSLLHDHGPANRFGIANAWIDRYRLSERGDAGVISLPEQRPTTLFHFFTLGEMAKAVEAEVG